MRVGGRSHQTFLLAVIIRVAVKLLGRWQLTPETHSIMGAHVFYLYDIYTQFASYSHSGHLKFNRGSEGGRRVGLGGRVIQNPASGVEGSPRGEGERVGWGERVTQNPSSGVGGLPRGEWGGMRWEGHSESSFGVGGSPKSHSGSNFRLTNDRCRS